jgi:hypothetical protein
MTNSHFSQSKAVAHTEVSHVIDLVFKLYPLITISPARNQELKVRS